MIVQIPPERYFLLSDDKNETLINQFTVLNNSEVIEPKIENPEKNMITEKMQPEIFFSLCNDKKKLLQHELLLQKRCKTIMPQFEKPAIS